MSQPVHDLSARAAQSHYCIRPRPGNMSIAAHISQRWAIVAIPMTMACFGVALLLLQTSDKTPSSIDRPKVSADRKSAKTSPSRYHPKVEPLIFARIKPDQAAIINEAIPFVPLGRDRPAPFWIAQEDFGYARALDCLASAVLYEAGDDPTGQAAVAQVVLNRLRHPAYPHSICAVVYQGAERTTGCQFTFTCDGALHRIPSAAMWRRAREIAASFLDGQTAPQVGMATHYHTEWVHPYWSATLDKIARVGPHLFFRWHGTWGRKAVFNAPYAGTENKESKLAFLSPPHRENNPPIDKTIASPETESESAAPKTLAFGEGDHFIFVDGGEDGGRLAMQGLQQCFGQIYCKVVGWDRRSQNFGSPQNPILRTVAFLYVSDKRTGVEIVLWDCARFNRPSDTQCLSEKNRRWITFQGDLSRAS